jgi:hypothetical protein
MSAAMALGFMPRALASTANTGFQLSKAAPELLHFAAHAVLLPRTIAAQAAIAIFIHVFAIARPQLESGKPHCHLPGHLSASHKLPKKTHA